MTVIKVTEAARSGHMQEFIEPDGTGYGRTYNRTFYVETDDAGDGMLIATGSQATALGLPKIHDTYVLGNEFDGDAIVIGVNPIRHPSNRTFWTVGIEYNYTPGFLVNGGGGEPTFELMIPEVRFFFVSVTKPVEKDRDDNPILNSAGHPFEPPKELEQQRLALQIVQNLREYSPSLALSFANKTNSDVIFGGIQIDEARMETITSQRQVIKNELFWRTEYNMQFDEDKWVFEFLDKGFHKLNITWTVGDPAHLRTVANVDGLGLPVSRQVLLKDGFPTTPDDPSYLDFNLYKQRAYAPLNLPPLVFSLTPET